MAQPLTQGIGNSGIHDRAILELLYSTGIRRIEIYNIRTADIALARLTFHVRQGKGNKDQVIPIGERATLDNPLS